MRGDLCRPHEPRESITDLVGLAGWRTGGVVARFLAFPDFVGLADWRTGGVVAPFLPFPFAFGAWLQRSHELGCSCRGNKKRRLTLAAVSVSWVGVPQRRPVPSVSWMRVPWVGVPQWVPVPSVSWVRVPRVRIHQRRPVDHALCRPPCNNKSTL